jgi:methionyl-tRNA formyltransferase
MTIGLYLMNQKGWSTLNQKGWSTLKVLLNNNFQEHISYVVSDRDLSVEDDFFSNIAVECLAAGIPLFTRKENTLPPVDYKLAIGWRWLMAESENLIVLHDSILPKFRGFAPLVNTLIKGNTEIGVTAIWAAAEFDEGDIIFQERTSITYPIKIQAVIELASELYQKICINMLTKIRENQPLVSCPQVASEASYSVWRDEEDYRIDWSQSAVTIKRFIDAVGFPYKGAQALVDDRKIHIMDATVVEDLDIELRHHGKVLKFVDNKPLVICGEGLLLINDMRSADGTSFKLSKFRTRFK